MPYTYNPNGQLVWTDSDTQAQAIPSAADGQFIPGVGADYLNDMGGGAALEQILGPPPSGYEYTANGGLRKKSALQRFDDTVMTPEGFAVGIGGAAVAPALLSSLGIGGGAAGGAGAGFEAGIPDLGIGAGLGTSVGADAALGAAGAGAAGIGTAGAIGAGVEAGIPNLGVGAGLGSSVGAGAAGATGAGWGGAAGTGLTTGKILSGLGDIGQIAGKAGSSAADSRYREGLLLGARDRAAADLFGTESNNALNTSKMGLEAPSARMKQVLLGELLANSHGSPQPVGSGRQHIVQYQTGLDALGPSGRQGGDELTRQALQALLTKSDLPQYPTAPALSPIPKAGVGENILGGVGIGGSILGALGKLVK